ncbi:hypothetical protein BGZ97_012398 [Linnemannia gamsii]|uniref:Uncharacterized protein n=1 Tax=Linnemannia gamsii TaxID=64522 RepID=A0A9P6R5G9_9FUNG|nr:hypothetical protein BGZ97_012398 [Linnemannia gamsii]
MASLLEEQIKLEQSQRMRFQSELQVELARHRNAILEKQELAALKRKGQLEFEREQEQERRRREEEEEEEIRRRQQSLQLKTTTTNTTGAESIEESTVSREASVQDRKTDNNKKSRNSTRTTQAPYTTVAASIIDPRYRTMFGYRGPEHPKSTPAELAELEQERRDNLAASIPTTTTTASSSSLSSPSAKVMAATRITAENRVRLAMMDYTPSQIEALTPEQASAILLPHFAYQAQEQSSSSLTHTDTDTTEDTRANTCAQIGDTRTTAATASTLVEDCNEEEEEDENRRRLRFTPDVMSSVSLHN